MNLEQIKEAYLNLPPEARREMAHWILARELSGRAGASLQAAPAMSASAARPGFPWLPVGGAMLGLLVVLGLAYFGWNYFSEQEKQRERQSVEERAAQEAARPNSPSNLEFYNATWVGKSPSAGCRRISRWVICISAKIGGKPCV
ncbi:MAG: hypothetical protein HC904_07220 [Blastochloris sp.]|nr:hypothetical protein [Blastochloris sp.]